MMRHASIREAANDRRGTGCRRAPDDHRRRLATHAENGNSAANGSEGAPGANGNGQGAGKRELLTPPDAHDYGEEGAFSETESGGGCADGGGGALLTLTAELVLQIGRASCRGRGEISGVAGSLKKKKKK